MILIETIFLLTVFAEIFVTTGGRPRPADHQPGLPDLPGGLAAIRRRQRLGRRTGRRGDRQHRRLLPGPHRRTEPGGLEDGKESHGGENGSLDGGGLGGRVHHLLPDPLDDADQLQERARRLLDAAAIPVLPLDHGELRRRPGAQRLHAACDELDRHRRRIDPDRHDDRDPRRLGHGLRAVEAHQRRPCSGCSPPR